MNVKTKDAGQHRQGYVGSERKQKFHRPECKWAQFIVDSPNLIEFASHEEAVAAGYKPCKPCQTCRA